MPEKYIKATDCEKYFYEHLDDVHIAGAMNAIDEMPAADVAPICHGHWITQEGWTPDDYYYTCSICNEDFYMTVGTPSDNNYKYCPNCGSRMDKTEKRNS